MGAANSYAINGTDIQEGMIISHSDNVFRPSAEAYDKNIFGVVDLEPAVEFVRDPTLATFPIVRNGLTTVLVSGSNGAIVAGDRITSSEISGIGMKALKSGFSLGIAQSSFTGTTANDVGTVLIALDIQFTFADDSPASETISSRLLDILKLNTIATLESPTTVMRYSLGVLSILGALTFSFFSFTRTAQKGIEAMGRNPLAKTAITQSVLINAGISILILGAGVGVAYLIVVW